MESKGDYLDLFHSWALRLFVHTTASLELDLQKIIYNVIQGGNFMWCYHFVWESERTKGIKMQKGLEKKSNEEKEFCWRSIKTNSYFMPQACLWFACIQTYILKYQYTVTLLTCSGTLQPLGHQLDYCFYLDIVWTYTWTAGFKPLRKHQSLCFHKTC